ncbi:Undecaprenyl-phosphate 4-deoxy-4-formamido-L-arabinose transferase [Thermoflexales bacterium]|nr:Undecaprenyl-phosphate 4-deoxy-4-formamido-L-arabinose transferase [Thermoflexales bacterium]
MKISLIVTVLNEARSLPALLDSIAAQVRRPDEVIICDGGSTDNTIELLRGERRFPVRVIERPGCNIAQGRNAAIAATTGEVIASTDAGVRLDPQWLDRLVAQDAILRHNVAAGFFLPDVHTPYEVAMGATVLPQLADVQPEKFLPSSRSIAFTKAAWQAVGGYPEWLDYCEDLVFDFALLEKYRPFAFVPEALVYFKPRGSLRSFFRQYYLYARGDGKANLWLKRHLIRYGTYLVGLPGIALLSLVQPWFLALYVIGALLYLKRPYQRLGPALRSLSRSGRLRAIGWVPLIRVAGDIAKMMGYPVGVWWRLTHKSDKS